MKAIWTGRLDFGLLSIPVSLYSAIAKRGLGLRLLHADDLAPVRLERVCSADGRVLDPSEVVRGYEYAPGRFEPVREADIERARGASREAVEVFECVSREDLDPMAFERPYFLAPEPGGERAYGVLREALERTHKVAIARAYVRGRPVLAALYPEKGAIALTTLRTYEELRSPGELGIRTPRMRDEEVRAAVELIERMSTRWIPERYRDEYRDRLSALIEARVPAARRARERVPRAAPATAQDLVDLLRKSVEAMRTAQRTTAPARKATTASTASAERVATPARRRAAAKKRTGSARRKRSA